MAYTAGSRQPCPHARTFMQISEQTVFNNITEHTRSDQFSAAEQILGELRDRLEAQVMREPLFHYPAATGDHWCVRDVYDHAILALKGLAAMHQQAVPEPAKQQLISRKGVVIDLEDTIQTSTDDTELGIEDTSPERRAGR
jgi:hypothetical protein